MNLLHAICGLDPRAGGPVSVLLGLTRHLAELGAHVTVVATWKRGCDTGLADQLQHDNIKIRHIGPCVGPLHWHHQIKPVIEAELAHTDVVHIHGLWEQIQHQAAESARRHRIPYVITPHGMLDPWSLAQKSLKKKLYLAWRLRNDLNHAGAIHFTSDTERLHVEALQLAGRTIVEPAGVDLSEFEHLPAKGSFRSRYPQIGDRSLVVFMGRIHPGKGLEYLVPAMARTKPSDSMLIVIGPDSNGYKRVIDSLVSRHGLKGRVIFTGMLLGQDRIAAMVDADIFALPSEHENFGVAVIEALASGTPVIVSEHVGIHSEITDARVGAATSLDTEALANELTSWLQDSRRRQNAGNLARPFVRQQYNWHSIARNWLDHYQTIIHGK